MGDVITITAEGEIFFAGCCSTGPNGADPVTFANVNPADGTCSYLICGQPDDTVPAHSLVGKIGTTDLTDFLDGFFVGDNLTFTATQAGNLLLGYNDGFVFPDRSGLNSAGVNDNSGSFTATIKRSICTATTNADSGTANPDSGTGPARTSPLRWSQ